MEVERRQHDKCDSTKYKGWYIIRILHQMNGSNKYHKRSNWKQNRHFSGAAFSSQFFYVFARAKSRDVEVEMSVSPPQDGVDGELMQVKQHPATSIDFIKVFVS